MRKEHRIDMRLDDQLMERILWYCEDKGIPIEEIGLSSAIRGMIARLLKLEGYTVEALMKKKADDAIKNKKEVIE